MPINPIAGTDEDDSILATDQRDRIHALAGDDWIVTAGGHDTVFGEGGDDSVFAYFGDEVLFGGDGNDQLVTSNMDSAGIGLIYGGRGDDRIFAGDRTDHSYGGAGNDRVTVYFANGGLVDGGAGVDTLDFSLRATDQGPSDERVVLVLDSSDAGAQVGFTKFLTITGFEALRITLNGGDDYVRGGDLGDVIDLGTGANTALGMGGDDFVSFRTGAANFLDGGAGTDSLQIEQNLRQGALTLTVTGTTAVDQFGSNLTGFESWFVFGGDGDDRASLGDGQDIFSGFRGDDTAFGNGGTDRLAGERGDDLLNGGGGQDVLAGGAGIDTLTGGAGADQFLCASLDRAGDEVTDFTGGVDRIVIRSRAIDHALAPGAVDAAHFNHDTAVGSDGQFILRGNDLIWDANGTADGGETRIVTFTTLPDLAASDITVF